MSERPIFAPSAIRDLNDAALDAEIKYWRMRVEEEGCTPAQSAHAWLMEEWNRRRYGIRAERERFSEGGVGQSSGRTSPQAAQSEGE